MVLLACCALVLALLLLPLPVTPGGRFGLGELDPGEFRIMLASTGVVIGGRLVPLVRLAGVDFEDANGTWELADAWVITSGGSYLGKGDNLPGWSELETVPVAGYRPVDGRVELLLQLNHTGRHADPEREWAGPFTLRLHCRILGLPRTVEVSWDPAKAGPWPHRYEPGGSLRPPMSDGLPEFTGITLPLTPETVAGALSVGPYDEVTLLDWVSDECLLAVAKEEGRQSLVELRRDPQSLAGWRAASVALLSVADGERGFVHVAGSEDGRSILFSYSAGLVSGTWRYDVAAADGGVGTLTKLGEGAVFKLAPDRSRVLICPSGDESGSPLLVELSSGKSQRWPTLADWKWNLDRHAGSSWSPDSRRYVYLEPHSDGVHIGLAVREIDREAPLTLAPPDKTLLWATWSPDSRVLAFAFVSDRRAADPGRPLGSGLPIAGHGIGLWDLASGETFWIEQPGLFVYQAPIWAPDGRALAFHAGSLPLGSEGYSCYVPGDVWVAERLASGWGQVRQVTKLADDQHTALPREWSPTGEALTIGMITIPSEGDPQYAVLDLRAETGGGPATPVWLSGSLDVRWLDAERLLVARSAQGQLELVICGSGGSTMTVLHAPPGESLMYGYRNQFALSPGKKTAAYAVGLDTTPPTPIRLVPLDTPGG